MLRLKFTPNPSLIYASHPFFEEPLIRHAHSGGYSVLTQSWFKCSITNHPSPTLSPFGPAKQNFRLGPDTLFFPAECKLRRTGEGVFWPHSLATLSEESQNMRGFRAVLPFDYS